jgi:hypothetical protein
VITFTASASGGSGIAEYYFTFYNPNSGLWSVGHPYSSLAAWTWNTAGLGTGTYYIEVWARNAGSTAAHEAYKGITYAITGAVPSPVSAVTLSMDKDSPQKSGAVITFTASASGGSGIAEYYFTFYNPNSGLWSVGHPYSSLAAWTWNTAGLGTGTYYIEVWSRNAGSTAAYEAYKGILYTLGY